MIVVWYMSSVDLNILVELWLAVLSKFLLDLKLVNSRPLELIVARLLSVEHVIIVD